MKIPILRPLILMDRPGREVEYIGGFLSHLKFKLNSLMINSKIKYDRFKPHIVYTVYENSKGILLKDQYKETAKIADVLGFTWETIYTGSKYFNKLVQKKCIIELIERYKRIIDFYKPDVILCYNESNTINYFEKPMYDYQQIMTAIHSGSLDKYKPFLTFGNLGNFTFILSEQDKINKVKAIDCNNFYIKNVQHKSDILKEMRYHGSRVGQDCAERFNIVQADNLTFKFLEG